MPAAATPGSPTSQAVIKEGTYLVNGTTPAGGSYRGTCLITALGDGRYKFQWRAGGSYIGTGKLEAGMISVDWGSDAPAIYKVNADGSLSGTWANGRATEFLKPAS